MSEKVRASILFAGLPCEPFVDHEFDLLAYDDHRSFPVEDLSVTLIFAQWTVAYEPKPTFPAKPDPNNYLGHPFLFLSISGRILGPREKLKMTRLEEIQHEVNCAVLEAIDEKLRELLPEFGSRKIWVLDKHLPRLLPALEMATEFALREVYDLFPESLSVSPAMVERTRRELEDSLKRIAALKASP